MSPTSVAGAERRYLALWFPYLSADRLRRAAAMAAGRRPSAAPAEGGGEPPLVFAEKREGTMRLAATNAAAVAAGLGGGLALAAARARLPELAVRPMDRRRDGMLLDALAAAGEMFTPLVARDGDDGLLFDVTGCAHLFGGEAGLAARVRRSFADFGMTARLALAGTPDAARALVRFAAAEAAPSDAPSAVRRLPVAALEAGEEIAVALVRAGLVTLGDLDDRPGVLLSARFGSDLVRRLHRILGREDIRLTPLRPPPEVMVERHFLEPLVDGAALEAVLDRLAGEVVAALERRGAGGRRFEASLFRCDGAVRRLAVDASAPTREAAALMRLLRLRLDGLADPLDPGFGFDAVRLAVPVVEAMEVRQVSLDGRAEGERELTALVDRLVVRFGPERVLRAVAGDSHDPLRAGAFLPATAAGVSSWPAPDPAEPPLRPLQIFARPEPVEALSEVPDGPPRRFRWRRVLHEVARAEGPERIAPEWWRAADPVATRDYYRVEDDRGGRFWLYREGFFGDGEPPRWYVHGLFA